MRRLIQKYQLTREGLLANRFLAPYADRLLEPALWRLNRASVARGVGLGVFFGFLLPFGQILAAALVALSVRANLIVAASSTFVTNPITNAPILFAAYKTGLVLLPVAPGFSDGIEGQAMQWALWLVDIGLPIAAGLLLFAVVGGAIGYFAARIGWRLWVARRWSRRRAGVKGRA